MRLGMGCRLQYKNLKAKGKSPSSIDLDLDL
jgi:hypothetical protein